MSIRNYARSAVSPERQHEIRNQIAMLLCEFFDLEERRGAASSIANRAIGHMNDIANDEWLRKEVSKAADAARENGATVEIDLSLPHIVVDLVVSEYVFQGKDASEFLNDCPDFLDCEDWLLWIAEGW